MSDKPRNDRFNVDEKHLARELCEAGIHDLIIPMVNCGVTYGDELKYSLSCSRCGKWKSITEEMFKKFDITALRIVGDE